MERIMQIFYGNDFLPYKDKERTIHYPIVGNTFNGMNNVNELHFYVRDIGGVNNLSWVAIAKLPNGRILYELLTDIRIDHEIEENYVVFNVSQFYTQLKGEVYISLNGCRGEVEIETDQETGISTISGEIDDNTVVATGSIKLAINYAPQRPLGFSFDVDQYQNILDALANKSGVFTTIQVVATLPSDLSGYNDGQLFYCNGTYYELVETSGVKSINIAEKNGLLGGDHALLRFVIDDDTTLEEIADFGKMFVIKYNLTPTAINEFLAYVNVVGSNILLYLLDIKEMKLYSYTGVASDTFADFLDSAEETTYVERQHSANILYGTNNSAQESALPYSVSVSGDKIVQRDSNGQINVPNTPTQNSHATSKIYGDTTYGKTIEMTIDENFDLVIKLKNSAGAVISKAHVDLPLESIVVSAQYYDSYTYQGTTYQNVIVITLATTSVPTIIPIGDLVSGLVDETTFNSTVTQLQNDINSRVAKKTTSGTFAYGHTNSSETEFGVTNNATSGTIPLRDTNGNIKVGNTPSNGGDATSKTYVDTFGRSLEFTIDNSTFVMTLKLKDNNGNVLSAQTVDLPLETMVVTGRYDDTTESLILELKNGQLIPIPISDLISGLVTETGLATTLANYYTKAQIDQMVSGFVFADVDDYLSTTSENPVENKVIAQELDKKANKDGNYSTMTVGVADQLSPYDEKSGYDQDEPFILQGTGTANGTQSDFSTGAIALMREKQGNTVVVNQKVQNPTFSSDSGYRVLEPSYLSGSVANNKLTLTVLQNFGSGVDVEINCATTIIGHKYLLLATIKSISGNNIVRIKNDTSSDGSFGTTKTINQGNVETICASGSETVSNNHIRIRFVGPATTGQQIEISLVNSHDLTQWFNGDIPTDIIASPSNFFRYYQGSLAYNTGTLVNANGRYIKCIGMNQWDGTNDVKAIPNATYYINGSATLTYKDREGNTISSESKTNETFTIPANCVSIGVSGSGDISINLYYKDESRCLTYEPYQVLTNNDTGTEVLRSAGSVKDYKTPDGVVHRLVDNRDYQSGDENDSSLLTDGTTTNYPLETPTTEQGTPYSENLVINDFGSMDFGGTNGVPQGNLIFYPVDYKAFIDTLYDYTKGTPSNLALNSELNAKFENYLKSLSGYDGSATQTLKNVNGTLTWVND